MRDPATYGSFFLSQSVTLCLFIGELNLNLKFSKVITESDLLLPKILFNDSGRLCY